MTVSSRLAWVSAFLLAAALFYAPLAYGCILPETWPPLFALLGGSILVCGLGHLLDRSGLLFPRLAVFCIAVILAQGWWMTWDPTFQPFDFGDEGLADTSFDNVRRLSFQAMEVLTFLLGGFLVFCEVLVRAEIRRFLLLAAALSGVLVSLIGIVLKIGGDSLMHYVWGPKDIEWTDFALYRYHGNAGAFLNLTWPLILVFTRRAWAPANGFLKKIMWTLAASACGLALFLNASKASLLLGLLILPWPFATWLVKLQRKTLFALCAVVLFLIVAGIVISSRVGDEEAAFDRLSRGKEVSVSLDGRLQAYQRYVSAMPQAGFFGTGPGLFQLAFPYQDSPLGNTRVGLREYAHEDYLQTLIEWGWVGAACWLMLIGGGIWRAVGSYRQRERFSSRTERHLLLAAILGLGATLVLSFIDFPLQVASLRLFFLLELALCWISPQLLTRNAAGIPYPYRRSTGTPSPDAHFPKVENNAAGEEKPKESAR